MVDHRLFARIAGTIVVTLTAAILVALRIGDALTPLGRLAWVAVELVVLVAGFLVIRGRLGQRDAQT